MADELVFEPVPAPRDGRWPPFSPLAPFFALLNRLIDSEPWAAKTLLPFAGKTARFELQPLVVKFAITKSGHFNRADEGAFADLTMKVPPAHLAALAMAPARAKNLVEIEGDTAFAEALGKLLEHLRPDLEEGLSRIFGDVIAMRILAGLNALRDDLKEAGTRLADNLAEYLLEETDALIRPNEVEDLSAKVRVLRDDLARLEKRIDRLDPNA